MVAAAVVGTVGSVVGSVIQGNAASSAASAQTGAANQANQTEQGFFNVANQNLQPFIQAGTNASNQVQQLEGIPTAPTYDNAAYQNALTAYNAANAPTYNAPSSIPQGQTAGSIQALEQAAASGDGTAIANLSALGIQPSPQTGGSGTAGPAPTLSQFQTSPGSSSTNNPIMATLQGLPGYQFANQQGLESVTNSNTARGLGLSGAQLKGAANYSTGLANQYYNNLLTGLQQTASTGAGSAASLAGAATSLGSSIGQNTIGAGNATAAGDIAKGNAISNAVNAPAQGLIASSLLQNLGNSGNGGQTNFLSPTSATGELPAVTGTGGVGTGLDWGSFKNFGSGG